MKKINWINILCSNIAFIILIIYIIATKLNDDNISAIIMISVVCLGMISADLLLYKSLKDIRRK